MEEAEALNAEEIEGIRETIALKFNDLGGQLSEVRREVNRQDEIIENKLKQVSRGDSCLIFYDSYFLSGNSIFRSLRFPKVEKDN